MSSGVEFDEDKINYGAPSANNGMRRFAGSSRPVFAEKQPRMVQWLMNHGIAVSPAAGQAILIGLIVVNLIITYIVVKYFL